MPLWSKVYESMSQISNCWCLIHGESLRVTGTWRYVIVRLVVRQAVLDHLDWEVFITLGILRLVLIITTAAVHILILMLWLVRGLSGLLIDATRPDFALLQGRAAVVKVIVHIWLVVVVEQLDGFLEQLRGEWWWCSIGDWNEFLWFTLVWSNSDLHAFFVRSGNRRGFNVGTGYLRKFQILSFCTGCYFALALVGCSSIG